jgi:hypothetical protein
LSLDRYNLCFYSAMAVISFKTLFAACFFHPVQLGDGDVSELVPRGKDRRAAGTKPHTIQAEGSSEESDGDGPPPLTSVPNALVPQPGGGGGSGGGGSSSIAAPWSTRGCLAFFMTVALASGLSVGLFMVTLHPLLVHRFHLGQRRVRMKGERDMDLRRMLVVVDGAVNVNVFHANRLSPLQIAQVAMAYCGLAVIPPLIIAALSKRVRNKRGEHCGG